MKIWQLQDAKAHFSELIQNAIHQGPQKVTLRGEPVAIVISTKHYDKLNKKPLSFVAFIKQSPLFGEELDLTRNPSPPRDVNL